MTLAELGEAAWTARDLCPVLLLPPERSVGRRAQLVELAAPMFERGLTAREVASTLGISRSYAAGLRSDPDRAKDVARKQSYAGTCERCGARTDGSNGREKAPTICGDCMPIVQHDDRHWTRETIVEAFHEAASILGRAPAVIDVARAPTIRGRMSKTRLAEARPLDEAIASGVLRFPSPSLVVREFGSWSAARVAAGFGPSPRGGEHSHREPSSRTPYWTRDRLLAYLARVEAFLGRPFKTADLIDPASISTRAKLSSRRLAEVEELRRALAAEGYRIPHPSSLWQYFGRVDAVRAALADYDELVHPAPAVATERAHLQQTRKRRDLRAALNEIRSSIEASPASEPRPEFRAEVERHLADARIRALETLLPEQRDVVA